MALAFEGKPVFITDSGDNVTSGATGWNTFILRQVLAVPQLTKRFLFSNICDPDTWQLLDSLPSGTETQITLGVGADANSAPVTLDVIVRSKGSLRGYLTVSYTHLCRYRNGKTKFKSFDTGRLNPTSSKGSL